MMTSDLLVSSPTFVWGVSSWHFHYCWTGKRSVDDGARKSNNWFDQWQSGKLGTGTLALSPFCALSRPQLTFSFCCLISLTFKGYLQAYHSKVSMTSLYSFFPANSLLLGILEGFNTTTLSPPAVLVSKIKYIKREHSKKLFFKPQEGRLLRRVELFSCHYRSGQKGTKLSKSCFTGRLMMLL